MIFVINLELILPET